MERNQNQTASLWLQVNLAKTKVDSRYRCPAFTFNGNEVERVQSYKYLGSEFHVIKKLAHGVSKLVSAANKAMHAMSRRCAFLHISDPKQRCKLFDSLVRPILSYTNAILYLCYAMLCYAMLCHAIAEQLQVFA